MDRLLLTIGLVLVILLSGYGLLLGWRHRAQRQAGVPELPVAPTDLGAQLFAPLAGLYVSSTPAGSWQDRLVAHGLGRRAAATLLLSSAGVLIDRVGETDIFIPAADLQAIGTAPGIAGKVMGMPDGILVITWSLGGLSVDSGLRLDDLEEQAEWMVAAQRLIPEAKNTNDGAST